MRAPVVGGVLVAQLVLIALLGGLVSGCGGHSADPPPASTSPSPTATSSPSMASPPTLPAAARAHTQAGAIAFVRHYIDLINYAQATGDVTEIKDVAQPGCASCNSLRLFIARLYSAGGSFSGGHAAITYIQATRHASDHTYGEYTVDATVRIQPSVVHPQGAKPQRSNGGTNILTMFPAWDRGAWRIANWSRAR